MRSALIISKPFAPPWRDSSKNLARELVRACPQTRFRVLAPRGTAPPYAHVIAEPIYGSSGGFEPGLAQNMRVLARLLLPAGADLYHFFFAPSRRTAAAARAALALSWRRRPSVQTLCSLPERGTPILPGCFADAVVVLSRHAEQRLLDEGMPRVQRIAPCVRPAPLIGESRRQLLRQLLGLQGRPVLLFAGDLEPARGAHTFVDSIPILRRDLPEATWVIAARAKTPRTRDFEQQLRRRVAQLGVSDCVRFVGETRHMRAWLAAADLQILVASSVEKKMDYPLVLLEGLALGLPIVVSDQAPLCELLARGRAGAGHCVAPEDPEALAHAVLQLCAGGQVQDLARQAARTAAADFAPERMARAYLQLYAQLLR